jgi:histidinol-phosphate aminotransferase
LLTIVKEFKGIVVLDEAYIDFSEQPSLSNYVDSLPNLVICQTFSKAYGMAGIRLGLLIASKELIGWINKIKPPYNVNLLTQEVALERLNDLSQIRKEIELIKEECRKLVKTLNSESQILNVYRSDANFILIKVANANELYNFLIGKGIVVRNRSKQPLCSNTLRLTVGTSEENNKLIQYIRAFYE